MLERASIGVLVGSSLMMVSSGIANVAGWYVFGFGFTKVHYAFAWVAIGALAVHIAVKLPAIRDAFSPAGTGGLAAGAPDFVVGAVGVAAGAVVLTVGSAVPPSNPSRCCVRADRAPARWACRSTAPRPRPGSPRTLDPARGDDNWQTVGPGPAGEQQVTASQLRALTQRSVSLPISCVEGWSAGATWEGVRVRDVLDLVGGVVGDVRIGSAERRGEYARASSRAPTPTTRARCWPCGSTVSADPGPRVPGAADRPEPSGSPPDEVGHRAGGAVVRRRMPRRAASGPVASCSGHRAGPRAGGLWQFVAHVPRRLGAGRGLARWPGSPSMTECSRPSAW